MRADPVQFALANEATSKRPRYVVAILFDVGSIYCTSHSDIPSVPGIVLEGVLKDTSAVSQTLVPDEGRSEIGAFDFSLIDQGDAFTDEIRDKLAAGKGLRGRTVQFWCGFEGFDFTAFQLFQTQVVLDASFKDGVYTVRCNDITREQRKVLFEPKFTTLRDSVSETALSIPVYSTTGFETIVHGTSWTDAPGSTVGYIKVENEVIRWSSKSADAYTVDGPTGRGALNTKAVAHEVDAGTAEERRTRVEEYIYLELPAVKMALAIQTGELHGTSDELPAHWHMGIDPALVRESDFTGIGPDIWDPSDDSAALPLRFEALKKTDGKTFLEREIYLPLGCFSPVYSDGTLGLRRQPALLGDAAPVITLTERELISTGELLHDMSGMHNQLRVNWNHDPAKNVYTRPTLFLDTESISIHGAAPPKEYSFRGLHGSRYTDITVLQRLHALRDAYAYPPLRIPVVIFGSLSKVEMGDVVRLAPSHIRDFTGAGASINRAFMVLNKRHTPAENQITLDLFGSTARPLSTPGTGVTAPLPDAFYTSEGTDLSTVVTITAGVMATGNYTLTGHASLNHADAIYYYDGDLTIPSGCNLTIEHNVQLRIRGFLTNNGTINGTGNGHAGVSDPGTGDWDDTFAGNSGFVGHSRGWDGVRPLRQMPRVPHQLADTVPAVLTQGKHSAFPFLNLEVSGTSLLGLPDDLRGTGGGPGGRILNIATDDDSVIAVGGTGGAGGAGLAIICRGMSLGVSATITLNGDDTVSPSMVSVLDIDLFPGAGGAGGPGALLILLDGNAITVPDITGKVFAVTGTVTQSGNPMRERQMVLRTIPFLADPQMTPGNPHAGYDDPAVISALDMSNAAHRIQYIPDQQTPGEDVPDHPVAPSNLFAQPVGSAIFYTVAAALTEQDEVEVWASIDNNRANAVLVGSGKVTTFTYETPVLASRWAWSIVRRDFPDRASLYSGWFPASATGGVSATSLNPGSWTPAITNGGGATMIVTANTIEKSGGTGAWDSQVYSLEGFLNGSALSFRAAQTNLHFMLGLNTDPTTDANYTSLDYAWFAQNDANAVIWESGVSILNTGAYDTSTQFEVRHDGHFVRYIKNGTVVREVAAPNRRLYLDSSFNQPGAKAVAVHFGPLNQATPSPFIARGNCVVSDRNVSKFGGSSAWDSDCFSINGYSTCHVSFKANAASMDVMVGLNADPATDSSFSSIDYAWYATGGSVPTIYENGSSVSTHGSYTTSTLFAITYDGTDVRYYLDNVLVRTVNDPGKTFYADSSFFTPNGGINSLNWGPTTNLAVMDTAQIGAGAATGNYLVYNASTISTSGGGATGVAIKAFKEQNSTRTYGNAHAPPENSLGGSELPPFSLTDTLALSAGHGITVGVALDRGTGTINDVLTITSIPAPLDATSVAVITATMRAIYTFDGFGDSTLAVEQITLQAVIVKR